MQTRKRKVNYAEIVNQYDDLSNSQEKDDSYYLDSNGMYRPDRIKEYLERRKKINQKRDQERNRRKKIYDDDEEEEREELEIEEVDEVELEMFRADPKISTRSTNEKKQKNSKYQKDWRAKKKQEDPDHFKRYQQNYRQNIRRILNDNKIENQDIRNQHFQNQQQNNFRRRARRAEQYADFFKIASKEIEDLPEHSLGCFTLFIYHEYFISYFH